VTILITDLSESLYEDTVKLAEVSGRTLDQVVHDALFWVAYCGAWADKVDPSLRQATPRTLWERLGDEDGEQAVANSEAQRSRMRRLRPRKKNRKGSRS